MRTRHLTLAVAAAIAVASLLSPASASEFKNRVKDVARAGQPKYAKDFKLNDAQTEQYRVNKYFVSDVIPKLHDCWAKASAQGQITFEYKFVSERGRWRPENIAVRATTVGKAAAFLALACMKSATAGTSFPATDAAQTYTLRWTWPFPLPRPTTTDLDAIALRASGAGEGDTDCDGRGTKPSCVTCASTDACKKVCVGHSTCSITAKVCFADNKDKCASGGPFALQGGLVFAPADRPNTNAQ